MSSSKVNPYTPLSNAYITSDYISFRLVTSASVVRLTFTTSEITVRWWLLAFLYTLPHWPSRCGITKKLCDIFLPFSFNRKSVCWELSSLRTCDLIFNVFFNLQTFQISQCFLFFSINFKFLLLWNSSISRDSNLTNAPFLLFSYIFLTFNQPFNFYLVL